MGRNCLNISHSYLPIASIKKGYTKSNIGHLIKIFRYKALKLLRSYMTYNGQERISNGQERINANDYVLFFAIESKRRKGVLVNVHCSTVKNPSLHLLPLAFQPQSADTHTVANTGGLTFDLFSVTRKKWGGGGGIPWFW
jgi:hypothetical protein